MKNFSDIIIIGGGASGTALLYVLAKYTNVGTITLLEKNQALGAVNSNAKNNSQTLHTGDIETHYTLSKVKQVKPAAELTLKYVQTLPEIEQRKIITKMPKMVLGVGEAEVAELEKRFADLHELFPDLKKIGAAELAKLEPALMQGRGEEPVIAFYNPNGYAVDFGALSQSLGKKAVEESKATINLNTKVLDIQKTETGYTVKTNQGEFMCRVLIVDADAYSLSFAKKLGYGKKFSLIPVAGTFYFSPKKLSSKVYTFQDQRMPFAAVHGDPDLTRPDLVRWGPTARFFPVLESRNYQSMLAYFRSSGLQRLNTWISFAVILLEPVRCLYLLKNLLYEIPVIGKYLFLKQVQKIVPTLRARDLTRAKGYGGMRLQRVDTTTHELLLGEGKIIGDKCIFNMTPSPGASVCLYNAKRDTEQIMTFFGSEFNFDKARFEAEFGS